MLREMINDMSRELSPKEIKILDAAAALMEGNISSIGTMKVADIAAHAGIGKGTVYEYFSSKEEIIQAAIVRFVTLRVEEEWAKAFEKPSFRECVYCAMEEMFDSADSFCVWDLQLLYTLDRSTAENVFDSVKDFCMKRMSEMCLQLMQRGVAEGLFPMPSLEKAGQAFVHLFGGFSLMMRAGNKTDYKAYMDRGYDMLIRALQ